MNNDADAVKVTHVLGLAEIPGELPFSGAENHVMTLVPALKKSGIDVELLVVILRAGPIINQRIAELEDKNVCVVKITKLSTGFFGQINFWYRVYNLLRNRNKRIIHLHLDFFKIFLLAKLAGCAHIILTIHNDEQFFKKLKARIWLRLVDRGVKRYIAISNHVKDFYISVSGIDKNKISTVYYGYELEFNNFLNKAEIRNLHNIPLDKFVIGFVGRLTEQKNPALLIEALKFLPDIYGVIIGGGRLEKRLRNLVNNNGISNIKFLGPQPKAIDLMPMFDALCLPSEWEGFGLVLLEAMLQKIPIIGSKISSIPEILGNGEYGLLFEHQSTAGLINQITIAFRNPGLVKRMSDLAFNYASNEFKVETMADNTIKAYELITNYAYLPHQ